MKKIQKLVVDDLTLFRSAGDNKLTKKQNDILIDDVSTLEFLARFAEHVFKGKIEPVEPEKPTKKIRKPEIIQTIVLSDLHFGADLKAEETGINFGTKEESRRFGSVIKQALQCRHPNASVLKLLLLGDIIENQLHDPRTGATIAEQVARAIHLLIQGIAQLAAVFPFVEVECTTGNHGRNSSRHAHRAVHQKWDSLETIIYYALQSACSQLKNVSFFIPKSPVGSYAVFKHLIAYTHGDTAFNPGNPGNRIDVKGLENQLNRLNNKYDMIVFGHTHVPHVVYLNNGAIVLGNGSLPPPDSFAVSIGINNSANGQWMFETTEENVMSKLKLLKVGKNSDKDEKLDTIIKPWLGF